MKTPMRNRQTGIDKETLERIDKVSTAVYDVAVELISNAEFSAETDCPLCGGKALVQLDFCCGVVADCTGCGFHIHMNLGLRFDDRGIDRRWPFEPDWLPDDHVLRVLPVVADVRADGDMVVEGYELAVVVAPNKSYPVCECRTIGEAFELTGRFTSAYRSMYDKGFRLRNGVLVGPDGIQMRLESLVS
jgi:hypothetical protein